MPNKPDYTYGKNIQNLEPYMLYGDRSTAETPSVKKDVIAQDLEYLQGMYPGHMKRLQEYVVSACDRMDYKNSPIYDEYPDRILVIQMCDSICSQIRKDGIIADTPFAEAAEAVNTASVKPAEEQMEWEIDDADEVDLSAQQRSSSWGPGPRPPWGPGSGSGPGPGQRPPWGPPGQNPPWGPGPRPPWGPGPGPGPGPGQRPPWGPPPGPGPGPGQRPPQNNNWLDGVISVLLLNEMHRRRCRSKYCR